MGRSCKLHGAPGDTLEAQCNCRLWCAYARQPIVSRIAALTACSPKSLQPMRDKPALSS